jgi:N-methylhydantoinase A
VLARKAGVGSDEVDDVVVHATTVVTNALIERKGQPTALDRYRGLQRRALRSATSTAMTCTIPQIEFPEPLITRELTFGVAERVLADGTLRRLGRGAGHRQARRRDLGQRRAPPSPICLLNSFKPIRTTRRRSRPSRASCKDVGDLQVSLSSVAPQIREYLRASTTDGERLCDADLASPI